MPAKAAGALARRSPSVLQQTGLQRPAPAPDTRSTTDESSPYLRLEEPPGPERLFRLESEAALRVRLAQEAKGRPNQERMVFPEDPVLSRKPYVPRSFPPAREIAEPAYVCYHRLLFEEKNSERYGWELGYLQPFVSAGYFFKDVALLPYHLGTAPCRKYECSAGYCLPGDPVPYLLYPPELSVTGTAVEASVILALVAFFP